MVAGVMENQWNEPCALFETARLQGASEGSGALTKIWINHNVNHAEMKLLGAWRLYRGTVLISRFVLTVKKRRSREHIRRSWRNCL